ncbi:MAG: hypothetical protein JNL70_26430 [Saprospiraceae bacterium]|nr:hypothetical protein [Saprospiraceae bacterium]
MTITKVAQLTGHTGAVFAITEGEDAQHILSGAGDGWVVEWDLMKPDLGRLIAKVERNIFSLLFLKNQNKIIAGDMDGGVRFVDLSEPSLSRNILHHGGKGCFGIKCIDNQVFTIGSDGILTRWSVQDNRSLESVQLSSKSLRCFDFSEFKNELAIGSSDGNIYFVDATSFELQRTVEKAHDNSVFSIKYTPDSRFVLTGGRDAHVKLFDTEGGSSRPVVSVPAHLFTINSIVVHPKNPHIFATASRDRTIKIWELTESMELKLLKVLDTIRYGCHIRSVNHLFWSSYNDYLISASDDRSLIVWQIDV